MTDTPKTEQRHRDAAADYARDYWGWSEKAQETLRCGQSDENGFVQAFARFEASLPKPAVSPELVERMMALIRATKADYALDQHRDEAHLILSELDPKPVDPVDEIIGKIAERQCKEPSIFWSRHARDVLRGYEIRKIGGDA